MKHYEVCYMTVIEEYIMVKECVQDVKERMLHDLLQYIWLRGA